MNCNETTQLLELLLLEALEPAQAREAAEHIAQCPSCRAEHDRLHLLLCEVQVTAETPGVTPGLASRISAAARAELAGRPRRRLWPRVLTWASAAAAAVLVVVALPSGKPIPPAPPVAQGPANAPAGGVERWRYPAPALPADEAAEGVVARGQSVYLLDGPAGDARVVAVDAATGRLQWRSTVPTAGHIEAAAERVFCLSPGAAGGLVCLSAADGRQLWRYDAPVAQAPGAPCRPLALRDRWVCWSAGADVMLLDAATGGLVWRRTLGEGALPSRATPAGESVCVATATGLWKIDLAAGAMRPLARFDRRIAGGGRPLLAMAGARAYLASTSPAGVCQLYGMDVPTGKMLWHREIPQTHSITVAGGGLYLRAQRVTALDAYTGQTLWTHAAEGAGPVSVQRGMVCFVDSAGGGRLVGLDPVAGRPLWEVAGVRSFYGLSPDSAIAYVQAADGALRALAVSAAGEAQFPKAN